MNNIASCFLRCLNDKGFYSQSYVKNNKMPEIAILVDNCGSQNKNNVTIRFLNMIKGGGFFGTVTLYFCIKGHTKNYCGRTYKRLKLLYQNQNIFTFQKGCGTLNSTKNVEVIQIFHENFFDLVSFLDDIYGILDPKNVNINHFFQVKKDLACIGYHQEFHGEADSEQNNNKENSYIHH